MKKAEIKRRKRVVPSHLAHDDQEEERRSAAPSDVPSPPYQTHTHETKPPVRPAGGPIPVDFTDTFRAKQPTVNDSPSPSNPRKRSFSAANDQPPEPYAHAQNMPSASDPNIDPNLPTSNVREPSAEASQQNADREARRARLQAEAERMRKLLQENERELAALGH